ncbi:MAG: STAS domain-containing protein [Gammaproteobacteria bacterium]|nr:STAS domain-containing protein [Gammaproteobacteria bacterium]
MRHEPAGASFALEEAGAGRLRAQGALVFATARRACAAGVQRLRAAGTTPVTIDCAGVTAADSAGLAVLLEWFGAARAAGGALRLETLPGGLRALARISEVSELLEPGVAPAP